MTTRLLPLLSLGLLVPAALAQPAGYPDYNGIVNTMGAAAANFPAICQRVNLTQKYGLAQTWQGRDMYAVKISDNVAQDEDEQAFLMVANHHGNEYGTPIIALDTIARLTQGYASDPQIKAIVDSTEIWIMPTCNPDGYWTSRHNRNPNSSVDLNRNYPFQWNSSCNTGVKGSAPGSEPEVKTVMALSNDQRFTKVIDFHTSGRETLYAYRQNCQNHQLTNYMRAEAVAISQASSYNGQVRGPSSNGEHYQWQLGTFSNYAFLTETNTTHSPSIASANNEATRVWPGTLFILERPVPVWGHVTDSTTGLPVEAEISYVQNPFTLGERNPTEPRFGRYHAFLPTGNHTLRVSASCYITQDVNVNVTAAGTQVEIQLVRDPNAVVGQSTVFNGAGVNPVCLSALNQPIAGTDWNLRVDGAAFPTASFTMLVGTPNSVSGPFLPAGQVLVVPNQSTFMIFAIVRSGVANASVPLSGSMLGATGAVQAFVFQGDERDRIIGFCNALDYTVGCL